MDMYFSATICFTLFFEKRVYNVIELFWLISQKTNKNLRSVRKHVIIYQIDQ